MGRLPASGRGAGAAAGHPDKGAVLAVAGSPTLCSAATVASKARLGLQVPLGRRFDGVVSAAERFSPQLVLEHLENRGIQVPFCV